MIENKFENNFAENAGGAIQWLDRKVNINESVFENNKAAIYGNDIASYAIDVVFVKDENVTEDIFFSQDSGSEVILKHIPSGQ